MVTTVSLKDVLLDGAREVFETMVFMALAQADPEDADLSNVTLLGSITFKGDMEGCLGVCCDETCARTIAANMLGMDGDEVGEEDVSDAMGEIANMVMGSVKSRIQDDVGAIEVSIPSVVQGRELKKTHGEGTEMVTAKVSIEEEYRAEFSLLFRLRRE